MKWRTTHLTQKEAVHGSGTTPPPDNPNEEYKKMRNVALALALVFGTSLVAGPVLADAAAVKKAKAECAKMTDAAKKAECMKKADMMK